MSTTPAIEERVAVAMSLLRDHASHSLEVLGMGRESVVLTDRTATYKVFLGDERHERPAPETIACLRRIVEVQSSLRSVPEQMSLLHVDDVAVLTYPYRASAPFTGGHAEDLAALAIGLHSQGLMNYGYRPSSFRVFGERAVLVDIGCDVVPFSAPSIRHNLERAYLTITCARREDLRELMARALRGESLRELDGFGAFIRAHGLEALLGG